MDVPGDIMQDAALRERAEEESAALIEKLKDKVKVRTKDIGTLRKQVEVTVPGDVISERLSHDFNEIRSDTVVPGFRKGHAPLKLVERRFASDVRKSLKTSILGQSFLAATENKELEVLGDPLFHIPTDDGDKLVDIETALDQLTLPDQGDFSYTCEVEVKPSFELPELKGIEIKSPQVEITDQMVDEHILRQRKIRGQYRPIEGGAAEPDDLIVADVALKVDGVEINKEENVQLGARPARLDGIPLMNLGDALEGVGSGDRKSVECDVPDDYPRTDLRGKKGVFEFEIHEIKRLEPQPLDVFVEQSGSESIAELRKFVTEDMQAERDKILRRAHKEQVLDHLIEKVAFDLPEKLSARQTDRAVMRRVVELQQKGVPKSEIEAKIDELRTSAKADVARDLKLEFIMEKVAEALEVSVNDEELNSEIAGIARLYNRRFDRIRDDLAQRGLLPQLAEQIRQDKCVEIILGDAKITQVAEKPKKKKPAAKTASKKTAAKKKTTAATKTPTSAKKTTAKKKTTQKKQ